MGGGSTLRPKATTAGAGAVRPPAKPRRSSLPPISHSSSPSFLLSSPPPPPPPPPPSSIFSASLPPLRSSRQLRDSSGVSLSEEAAEFDCSPVSFLLGPAPSEAEAEAAVAALNQIYNSAGLGYSNDGLPSSLNKNVVDQAPISDTMHISSETMGRSSLSEQVSDKIELARQLPANHPLRFNGLKIFQSQGLDRIRNSFRLMQSNLSVQRMVLSLSTDKAVWDAVMKNEAVQLLKQHFPAAGLNKVSLFDEDGDIISKIQKWILENIKAKIWELIDKIIHLVDEQFFSRENAGNQEGWDILSDVVRSAFMLTVMVFLVVIVTRVDGV